MGEKEFGQMRRHFRVSIGILGSALILAALAACGSGEPSDASGSPTSERAAESPTSTVEPTAASRPTARPSLAVTSAETDREALVALYNATGGESWNESDNWLSNADMDEWTGVVTDGNGRVIFLRLDDNQLSGEISPALGNLAALEDLSLTSNRLSGEIPPELGNLVNLVLLGFYGNQLSGCVPQSLEGRITDMGGLSFCGE